MRESLAEALAAVVELAGSPRVLLGGSAMLALRGLDVEPNDIDLMAAARDRGELERAMAGHVVAVDENGGKTGVTSEWRLHLRINGEPAEIMGGLSIERSGVAWQLPLRSDETVAVAGASVRLAAVAPWVALYTLINASRAAEAMALVRPGDLSEIPDALGIEWPPEAKPPR